MNGQQAAAAVTVEAILARVEARARDIRTTNVANAARLASPYARGLAEGHADAAGMILEVVEALRAEVAAR